MARHEKWQAGFVGDNEPFTLAQLGIEFFRGWPRGYDLAAALQNNLDARKFLEESGDTEYYYYRRQRRAAREVWLRASDSGEFSCAEKWDLPWADRLPVRVQLLQVAQMSAEPSRAVRPDVYVWQDAHRLARLNTSLAYCAWLNHEYAPAGFYQTNDVLKPLNAHVGNEGKQAAGYIDPFPHVYERLADSCRRMADLCEEHLGPKNPTTRRCIEMQALMKRAEEVAVNEITKPDSMALADARWIDQWAAHLRNALNDESLSGIYVGRDARDSVAVAAVPWMRRSRALQMATGPLWALQTTVAVGEEDREVVGAIFSFYEFKSDSSALVGNADWRAMLSSGTAGAPLLLRQLVPPPAVTSRLNDIVEASPHNKMEPQMAR
jgi:hypothetical protein